MKKNNNSGFTLIELLATIAVLALVLSITIYVALGALKKAREKSYQVTIKNIEGDANNYLLENKDRLFFVDGIRQINGNDGSGTKDTETYLYQCVTVQNLVDFGYLKSDVINSKVSDKRKVKYSDFIYIERNSETKAIEKNIYVNESINSDYLSKCRGVIDAIASISFESTPDINEWSREKDILITYRLKNLNDVNDFDKYINGYRYSDSSKIKLLNETSTTKTVKVMARGTLTGDIKKDEQLVIEEPLEVLKIDWEGPIIKMGKYDGNKTVSHTVTIPLSVTDIGIGVDHTSFTKDDIVVKVGDNTVGLDNITLNNVDNEIYNLTISNNTFEGNVIIEIDENKILDKLTNPNEKTIIETDIVFKNKYYISYDANGGTGAPGTQEYTSATPTVKLSSTIPTRTSYIFLGWSEMPNATVASYNAGGDFSTSVLRNITLYAVWEPYVSIVDRGQKNARFVGEVRIGSRYNWCGINKSCKLNNDYIFRADDNGFYLKTGSSPGYSLVHMIVDTTNKSKAIVEYTDSFISADKQDSCIRAGIVMIHPKDQEHIGSSFTPAGYNGVGSTAVLYGSKVSCSWDSGYSGPGYFEADVSGLSGNYQLVVMLPYRPGGGNNYLNISKIYLK